MSEEKKKPYNTSFTLSNGTMYFGHRGGITPITENLHKDDLWVQCCSCKIMIRQPGSGKWFEGTLPQNAKVSHSYCPECYKVQIKEAEKLLKKK
jgi:hypothetical protein